MPKVGRGRKPKNKPQVTELTCLSCGQTKKATDFYASSSVFNAGTNRVQYCKECCINLSMDDKGIINIEKFKNVLEKIDKPFLPDVLQSAYEESKKRSDGKEEDNAVALYFKNINSLKQYRNLTWKDSVFKIEICDGNKNQADIDQELKLFWGFGFSIDDYIFLESELARWKKTHKCDNQSELTLLREICITILEIRKARERNESTTSLKKELQELMKTAAVDPAKANIADNGKSLDSYGLWLKDIEEYEPAEYFADKQLFVDFDGIKTYVDKYIYRPLRNLLTGSREFNIDGYDLNDDGNDDESDD